MGMSEMERATLLGKWIKPSSDSEQTQQARAEDMVRKAITTDAVFDGSNILIYTKGSYPNNTNVKLDSDVDVVVEPQDCSSSNYQPGVTGATPSPRPYGAEYEEHLSALRAHEDGETDGPTVTRSRQYGALRLALITHKRATVVRLRDEGVIDDTLLRRIQARLDIEELRLSGTPDVE